MTRWERFLNRVGLYREVPVVQAVALVTSPDPEQPALANSILAHIQESDDPELKNLRAVLNAIANREDQLHA